jgi:hypothetical protein
LNVFMKSLIRFLVAASEIPGINKVNIGALEVPHKNLHMVSLVMHTSG